MRPHFVDGDVATGLARDGRECGVLEAARRDPLRERRRIEADVQRVAVRRHPTGDVHADGGDLLRRRREPDAGEPVDALAFEPERRQRPDERFLEVPHVLLDVAAVPLQVDDRIADELARPVIRRLAAAVGLDDLDLRALRQVQLRALVRPAAERDHRGMLEEDDRVGDRALRHRAGKRTLQVPRFAIRHLPELEQVSPFTHLPSSRGARADRAGNGPRRRRRRVGGRT